MDCPARIAIATGDDEATLAQGFIEIFHPQLWDDLGIPSSVAKLEENQ